MFSELKSRLETHNFITLHDYMALCNAHYYGQQDSIGAAGDFITAPEISQIFGELLGVWVVQRWQEMGRPKHLQLIELGPGKGTLISDMLRVIRQFPGAFNAIEIHLLENSPRLREMQKQAVAEFNRPVQWHDDLDRIAPAPFIIIANEFLDALPIRQLVYSINGWLERGVSVRENKLQYATREIIDPYILPLKFPTADPIPGSVYEECPLMGNFLRRMLQRMQGEYPGSALMIDYGYSEHAFGDTFQALHHHQFADPLERPGEQDLTAHVNFAAIRDFARQWNLQCAGPIGQGAFLKQIGAEIRAEKILQEMTAPEDKLGLVDAMHRLTAPSEMGALFKVICLSSPQLPTPEGFIPA